VLINTSMSVSK